METPPQRPDFAVGSGCLRSTGHTVRRSGLSIVRADIATERADAIVTPAHRLPVVGDGADRAIHAAAGPSLLAERRRLGVINPCDVRATPAGNLHAKFVLHALGPIWEGGERNEALLLRLSYLAVMREAVSLRCHSVSVPLLSAGHYGFPPDEALDTAVAAISGYLETHPGLRLSVRLVVLDDHAFRHALDVFPGIVSSELTDAEADALVAAARPPRVRRLRSDETTDYYRDVEWRMRRESFAELYGRLLDDFLKCERTRRSAAPDPGPRSGGPFVVTKAEVARRAGIDYEYFKRLCRPTSTVAPGRDKVLALAMAIRLNRHDTERLLGVCGHRLDPANQRVAFILGTIGGADWNNAGLSDALVRAGFLRLILSDT